MAASQNGWTGITSGSDSRLVSFAPITGKVLGGNVAAVFGYLAGRFAAEVEPIDKASSWGWAYRSISGATGLSNHASGTAIDLNAPRHQLGKIGTFTAAQQSAIRAILTSINAGGQVVRWGGDYTARRDEMHFEIVGNATQVAAAAARLTAAPAAPTPAGKSVVQLADEVIAGQHGTGATRRASLGSMYDAVQAEVNRRLIGSPAPGKSVAQMASEVIAGQHGTGHAARQASLGVDAATYAAVRAEVNRRMR